MTQITQITQTTQIPQTQHTHTGTDSVAATSIDAGTYTGTHADTYIHADRTNKNTYMQ